MNMYHLDKGSFTELAAIKRLNEGKLVALCSPRDVAIAVKNDKQSLGTLAYRNSIAGIVDENVELIRKYGLKVVDRVIIHISPCIGGYRKGNCVYSHEKALAQCSDFLDLKYPDVKRIKVSSTAYGIKKVKEEKSGLAIGRKDHLITNGLEILAENIANRESYTEFFIVRS